MTQAKSQAHREAISAGQRRRWEQLRTDWEQTNRELETAGMPTLSLREYERGLAPKSPKPKYVMTREHKAKLRQVALEHKYVERLKPYQFKKKYHTDTDRERAKETRRLKNAQHRSQMKYNMQFAREAVTGVHGNDVSTAIVKELEFLDCTNRQDMLKVVYYLVEIGFLEMYSSSVSLATRHKMSRAALERHQREREKSRV